MSFEWSVSPYRWKKLMVEQYTSAVMVASRKKAKEHAIEAEAWMKKNAPWQDRTLAERVQELKRAQRRAARRGVAFQKSNAPFLLGAREGLWVGFDNKGEVGFSEAQMRTAERRDEQTLNRLNKEREIMRREAEKMLRGQMVSGPELESAVSRLSRRAGMRPLKAVPRGQSAVTELKRDRLPIVSLRFGHEPRVHYALWLEIANGGRYSIIGKTVEHFAGKYFEELRRIANLKQYRDRIVLGGEVSEAETFEKRIDRFEEKRRMGNPNYIHEPWTQDKRMERKRRRKYYKSQKSQEWRARALEAIDNDDTDYEAEWKSLREREEENRRKRLEEMNTYRGPRLRL